MTGSLCGSFNHLWGYSMASSASETGCLAFEQQQAAPAWSGPVLRLTCGSRQWLCMGLPAANFHGALSLQQLSLLSLQELLTRAHTTDTGPETTRMRMLLCVEEAKLFEAGRHSIKAVEAWR